MSLEIVIGDRKIGLEHPPFIIAEIGINHEGDMVKAKQMVDDAHKSGAECVKFQAHVVDDEMIPEAKKVVPGHTKESIWEIMDRCAFTEDQDLELKQYVEERGMLYLSTPFSRAAADRLHKMDLPAYKIGSGECNNYPLIEHIASFGKPVLLSTGMNNVDSIKPAVEIFRKYKVPFVINQCTSLYPTPYDKAHLGAIKQLAQEFPDAVIGFSDHTVDNYASFGAVALGAAVIEKHFTSNKSWPGPDIALSVDPSELKDLIKGCNAVYQARSGAKEIFSEEQPTIDFAYACVVTIKDIKKGDTFSKDNLWVKRPGTGEIKAVEYESIIGKKASRDIAKDIHLSRKDIN